MTNLDNGHSIWIIVLWTFSNIQEIVTLRIYFPRKLYHKSCYGDIASTTKIECGKKRYHDSIESSLPSVVKQKVGRSSSSTTQMEKDNLLTTRSKVKVSNRKLCIICKTRGTRSLTRVEFEETGIHMLKVSKKLVDKSSFVV